MEASWVGYCVSIKCADSTLRGCITRVNAEEQTIALSNVVRNGIPCPATEISIRAKDIKGLEILQTATSVPSPAPVEEPPQPGSGASLLMQPPPSPRKFLGEQQLPPDGSRSPHKKDRQRQRWTERDEAAFGAPINNFILEEFDFEKNLALFDKQAVYDKINASQRPDVVRQADQKYRHDENVIEAEPASFRQVVVPEPDCREYVTDSGLVLPSVSLAVRDQLLGLAERLGLTFERQAELIGRAATEMALQLLGGGHRLNPRNAHQWPTVVALCGGHRGGVLGANCARHLASHGVRVLLLAPDAGTSIPTEMYRELALFRLTKNPTLSSVKELPKTAVDLILLAVDDPRGHEPAPSWLPTAAAWANQSRASVLALDPPPQGSGVQTKLSLVGGLPLAHSSINGKLYLCNLGIPVAVFQELGISYSSPFGPKFVIPLHPHNDT